MNACADDALRRAQVYDTVVHGNTVTTKVKGNYAPFYLVSSAWQPLSQQVRNDEVALGRKSMRTHMNVACRALSAMSVLHRRLPVGLFSSFRTSSAELAPQQSISGDAPISRRTCSREHRRSGRCWTL
jgi:hypothetical protein